MSQILARVNMELLSDAIFSSGNSIPGGADITLRTDSQGAFCVPGSTMKGLLREAISNYMSWTATGSDADLDALLGCIGICNVDSDRRLVFGDLHPQQVLQENEGSYLRTFTQLVDGVAKSTSLHTAICLQRGIIFSGVIICAEEDAALIENSLRLIQWVGLMRTRGFGHVRISFQPEQTIQSGSAVPAGSWIRYRLRLHTPVAITMGANAPMDEDRKNYTDGNTCIPGSAIRGMVMSHLAQSDPQWFADNKEALLRQVSFRDALPMSGGEPQIPIPMGFYADRDQANPYSVLTRDVAPGHKRARLGRYCRMDDTCLYSSSPLMDSILHITINDPDSHMPLQAKNRQMFTVEALAAGTVVEGYIRVPDPLLTPRIAAAFRTWLCIGADRFSGCGLCTVELLDGTAPDRTALSYRPEDPIPETLCMLLLSPTALMQHGEVCALNDERLARLLGVTSARIERCATSLLPYAGFNRTWGCATPTVSMYAPGSVFRIRCSEAPSAERLRALEEEGIGIRRNEGCGQVLFLRNFFQLCRFTNTDESSRLNRQIDTEEVLRRRARYRWLLEHALEGSLSTSQIGTLQALCRNILAGTKTIDDLEREFNKNISKASSRDLNYADLRAQAFTLLETPMHITLGCAPYEDSISERLQLFNDLISMNRKEDHK